MRIVFMGTPDFAVPALEKLIDSRFSVEGVITRPDRPKGRGLKPHISPIKQVALKNNIRIWQPQKLSEPAFLDVLREVNPDLIVVVAFGQILSRDVLSIPPLGCVNLHASLLPFYRGAAPIHRAVINGEKKTGVTTMMMSEELDAGDILLQKEVPIGISDTTGKIHDRLAAEGAGLLLQTVGDLLSGNLQSRPQDHRMATYAPPLKPDDEIVDWGLSAVQIYNQVRGLNPWPVARTWLNERLLKIWSVRVKEGSSDDTTEPPGKVIAADSRFGELVVQAGKGQVMVKELQVQGKRRMKAEDFLRGFKIFPGMFLGQVK